MQVTYEAGDRRPRYGWVVAVVFQLATLAGYFGGLGALSVGAAIVGALGCVIVAVVIFARRSLVGLLPLCVGLTVPILMRVHARYSAKSVRARVADFEAALPFVLEADSAHCMHPPRGSVDEVLYRCELQNFLPPQVKELGRRVWVQRAVDGAETFFQLLPGTRMIVAHAPQWPAGDKPPYYSLGNGWHTTLPP